MTMVGEVAPASNEIRRHTALAVGGAYLAALPLALFSEFYVSSQVGRSADPAAMSASLIAHEPLVRAGIASNLMVVVVDAVLIAGLYLALRGTAPLAALAAAFIRLLETSLLALASVSDFVTLRLLGRGASLRGT